ncbi:MAG: hypothetical protein IJU03_00695 [Thermoguttaceae bacterium]|nr:hypothetical protein [Thermoguttaceae bacterium]
MQRPAINPPKNSILPAEAPIKAARQEVVSMNKDVNVLALVKGKERYVFLYNGQNRESILDSFGRYASDPDLSFTWFDAAVLTQKVMREKDEADLVASCKSFKKRISKRRAYDVDELAKKIAANYDDVSER